jgi:hypothetical protein
MMDKQQDTLFVYMAIKDMKADLILPVPAYRISSFKKNAV